MYEIEATVTETGPPVLRLTADWPVDWLRDPGIRTMEIQREFLHGELECSSSETRVQQDLVRTSPEIGRDRTLPFFTEKGQFPQMQPQASQKDGKYKP